MQGTAVALIGEGLDSQSSWPLTWNLDELELSHTGKAGGEGCHFRKSNNNSKGKEVDSSSLLPRTIVDLVSGTYLLHE